MGPEERRQAADDCVRRLDARMARAERQAIASELRRAESSGDETWRTPLEALNQVSTARKEVRGEGTCDTRDAARRRGRRPHRSNGGGSVERDAADRPGAGLGAGGRGGDLRPRAVGQRRRSRSRRVGADFDSAGADPVRLYLREMGKVALLTRDGEVRIARRIEDAPAPRARRGAERPGRARLLRRARRTARGRRDCACARCCATSTRTARRSSRTRSGCGRQALAQLAAARAAGAQRRPRPGTERPARRTGGSGAPGEAAVPPSRRCACTTARSASAIAEMRQVLTAADGESAAPGARRPGAAAAARRRARAERRGGGRPCARRSSASSVAERAVRAGQEGADRSQPAPGGEHRQEVHQPRPAAARPDPGRQHRPDARGRQVRVPARLQVLDLRHLVDSPGDDARHRRPVAHHPHSGAHDRDASTSSSAPRAAGAGARPRADAPRSWPPSSRCRPTRCAAC